MAMPMASEEAIIACARQAAQQLGVPYPSSVVTFEEVRPMEEYVVRHVGLPPIGANTRATRVLDTIRVVQTPSRRVAIQQALSMLGDIGGEAPILLKREPLEKSPFREGWALTLIENGGLAEPEEAVMAGFNST